MFFFVCCVVLGSDFLYVMCCFSCFMLCYAFFFVLCAVSVLFVVF